MRIALGIEYDGTAYQGWQRQRNGTGVQSLVERALSRVANQEIDTVCAGRTDAGVHAEAQVVHFDTDASRTTRSWLLGTNSNLPDDISASWAAFVDDDFHARYSALARSYRYLILNRLTRSALYRQRAWWVHWPLDADRMNAGARHLLGEHDFSAFRAAGCQARTPVREIFELSVRRQGEWLLVHARANAFLQHMVRNIVGLLVTIGRGEKRPGWARQVLEGRDRTRGGPTAPPQGLSLVSVEYPERYALRSGPGFSSLRLPGMVDDPAM